MGAGACQEEPQSVFVVCVRVRVCNVIAHATVARLFSLQIERKKVKLFDERTMIEPMIVIVVLLILCDCLVRVCELI